MKTPIVCWFFAGMQNRKCGFRHHGPMVTSRESIAGVIGAMAEIATGLAIT